jgi:MoaA/NifB/PqqE/SkfB family radical SAM enzyme
MYEYNGKELIIMACSSCNANCSHCYISYKGNRNPNELLEIVRKFKNKYSININGAEVLINPEYLKSYKEIRQPFVLSNGKVFLTNKDIFDKLHENDIKSVSLSYHFGIHDDISPVTTKDLDNIINIIKNNGLDFRLLTTITSKNYNQLSYMCERAKELGARGIKFTNFMRQGNAKNMSNDEILSKEQINEFFKLLMIERSKYKLEDLIIERCGTFGKNELSNHDNFYCDCITDSVVLTPDNNIYPCVFLAQPGYEIGKYMDGKVYIYERYLNNHNECLAKEACNEYKRVLRKER